MALRVKSQVRSLVANRQTDSANSDFFVTEPKFTHLLLDNWTPPKGDIWEPACGDGAISKVLMQTGGRKIISTDLANHNFGRSGVDFLKAKKVRGNSIITNPPFSCFDKFVHKALEFGVPFAFLYSLPGIASSQARYRAIFGPKPPNLMLVVTDKMKIRFFSGVTTTSMFNHVWLIWDKRIKCSGETKTYFVLGGKDYYDNLDR